MLRFTPGDDPLQEDEGDKADGNGNPDGINIHLFKESDKALVKISVEHIQGEFLNAGGRKEITEEWQVHEKHGDDEGSDAGENANPGGRAEDMLVYRRRIRL